MNNEFMQRNADRMICKAENRPQPKRTPWIMESTQRELYNIIVKWMDIMDDYQQIAADYPPPAEFSGYGQRYFVSVYDTLDTYRMHIRKGNTLTYADRNNIRLTCKEAMKAIGLYSTKSTLLQ